MGDSNRHQIKIGDLVNFRYWAPNTYDLERKKKAFGIVIDFSERYETVYVYWLGRTNYAGWYLPNDLKAVD